jgi:hypothetical protein
MTHDATILEQKVSVEAPDVCSSTCTVPQPATSTHRTEAASSSKKVAEALPRRKQRKLKR